RLHRIERLRKISAAHPKRICRFAVPFLSQHPPRPAKNRSPGNARSAPDRWRHHEFLDPGHAQRVGGNLETGKHFAHQRHRNQNAGRRKESSTRRQKSNRHGSQRAGSQARRIRRHNFLPRRRLRHWHASLPRSCPAHRRGKRSHRSRRLLCRRLHGLHSIARRSESRSPEASPVLRRSHGIVRRRTFRNRASPEPDPRRNRSPLPNLPRTNAPRINRLTWGRTHSSVQPSAARQSSMQYHKPLPVYPDSMQSGRRVTTTTTTVPTRSTARLAGIPALVSLFSFIYYFRHSDLLLYGDAVAHINIARRVFDSQTPGLWQ